jgi:hypothetical protein
MLASILAREMEAFSFQRSALSFRSSAVSIFDFGPRGESSASFWGGSSSDSEIRLKADR